MAAPNTRKITVPLSELQVGVVVPADVFDALKPSVLLIRRGVPITESLLRALKNRGVKNVSVDEASAAIMRGEQVAAPKKPTVRPRGQVAATEEPKTLGDRLTTPKAAMPAKNTTKRVVEAKSQHSENLKVVFSAAQKRGAVNTLMARQITSETVANILPDIDGFLKVALQNNESSEVYEHCLATAQLAMSVGVVEGMPEQSIHDLGTGCMLSRLGQSEIAEHYAQQVRELTDVELLDIKRTPLRTFDYLQTMSDVSVGARSIAYQIFERFDGSGYPRGRAGNQITPLSRLAAVCDVYVALTSPRPHREAFEPYQAVEQLLSETREKRFDPMAVRGLLRTIGLFPIGSFVRLVDNRIGQVVRNHRDAYDRPTVHIFFDDEYRTIKDRDITVDLSQQAEFAIAAAVPLDVVKSILLDSVEAPPAPEEPVQAGEHQLSLAFN